MYVPYILHPRSWLKKVTQNDKNEDKNVLFISIHVFYIIMCMIHKEWE